MHDSLITQLGGAARLRRAILAEGGPDISPQAISHWRRRGIAYRLRPVVAKIARDRRIPVPDDFLMAGTEE